MITQPLRQRLSAIEMELRQELTAISADLSNLPLSDIVEQLADKQLCHHGIYARLVRLDAAMCQLDIGMYGLCSDCEAAISATRLQHDPTEQRCEMCEELHRHEHRQELRLTH